MNTVTTRMTPALIAILFALLLSPSAQAATPRPNIILVLADDIGVEALQSYGGESYQTPRLDQLAAEGIRFENTHAQPLCTPSRVKLMTGQYNFRNYQHFMYLDPAETTFAHVLRDAGYRTLIAGKWQLIDNGVDDVQGMHPRDSGFDDYFLWQVHRKDAGSRYWGPRIDHNGEAKTYGDQQFGPTLFNDYVLDYMQRHVAAKTEQPFLIYYTMALPHLPLVTTPDSLDANSKQEKFAGMVGYMDTLMGRLRDKTVELGIADNTLILFVGDNGSDRRISSIRHGQLVPGGKGQTDDSGTHVPFIGWWPGTVAEGRVSEQLINFNDFFPTLLELAGAEMPAGHPRDGISLVTTLKGDQQQLRQQQFIHYDPKWFQFPGRFAFDRQWKLYESGEFYHRATDPFEKNPLAEQDLNAQAREAKARLQAQIAAMPGGPVSSWPTAPDKVIPIIVGAVLATLILLLLLLRWGFRRIGGG